MIAWSSKKSLIDARSFAHWERCVNTVIEQYPERLPMTRACEALGLNRSSVYGRRKRAVDAHPPRRSRTESVQPRALSKRERERVIETLHSVPYCDQPPAEVYQRLLEKDQYLCSVSTMHRLLPLPDLHRVNPVVPTHFVDGQGLQTDLRLELRTVNLPSLRLTHLAYPFSTE